MMRLHFSVWHLGYLLLVAAIGMAAIIAAPPAPWLWLDLAVRVALGALVAAWCARSLLRLRRFYPLDLRYHRGQWQVHRHGSFVDARLVGTVWSNGLLMLACLRCDGAAVPLFASTGNMRWPQLCCLRRLVFQESPFDGIAGNILLVAPGDKSRLP